MKLRDWALQGIVLEAASECVGVFPAKVTGGDKPYEFRSEWQEGWNACSYKLLEMECVFSEWLEAVEPAPVRRTVEDLLLASHLSLHYSTEGITMFANCSDAFYWGTADAEDVAFDDLPLLLLCYNLSPKHGNALYAARKRVMRPQAACYKYYTQDEVDLFDACGPVRTDPDGARKI